MKTVIPPTIVPFTNSGNNLPIASIHLLAGVTYDLSGTIFNVFSQTGAAGQTFYGLSFSGTVTSSSVEALSSWVGGTAGGIPVPFDTAPLWSPATNNAPGIGQDTLSGTITPATDGDLTLYAQDFVALNGDTITVSGTLVAE